jgi:acyl-CoA reductase-like NAD-dependent aldehyde dehydrogenase
MFGKCLNAGQTCIAPDYVLVPEERVEEFVSAARNAVGKLYPTLRENPDYTAIINARHRERLAGYLGEARAAGARVEEINPAAEDLAASPKMAPDARGDLRADPPGGAVHGPFAGDRVRERAAAPARALRVRA